MKLYKLSLILLIVSLMTVGCIDTSTPKGVVEMLIQHLRQENYPEAEKLFTDPSSFQPIRQAFEENPINQAVFTKLAEKASITVDNETINGNNASVDVTFGSIAGEALSIVRQHAEEVMKTIPEGTSKADVLEKLKASIEELDWNGLKPQTFTATYHLEKVDGKWLIDSQKTSDPVPLRP